MLGLARQALTLMGMAGSMGGPWKSSAAPGLRTAAAVEEYTMTYRVLSGNALASLWLFILPVWAMEYRLQVTNINFLTFSSYLDRSSASPRSQETMQRLETRLDNMEFSTAA